MKSLFTESIEPNVESLMMLVKELKVNVTRTSINESLHSHADYPSLLSLSETLNKWEIENSAIRTEKDNIRELKTPFLAHFINKDGESFVLVTKTTEKFVFFKDKINQKKTKQKSIHDFFKEWTGVALLANPTDKSGELDYSTKLKEEKKAELIKKTKLALSLFFLLIICALPIINLLYSKKEYSFVISITFLLFLKLIGLSITLLLFWQEIDKKNISLQKFCTQIINTDCNAVLNSKYAKFLGLISWSEIGFFYFLLGLISLFQISNTSLGLINKIVWLNVIAIPYIVYSIYVQWRVIKEWCIMCLGIQAILISEFIISISSGLLNLSPFEGTVGFWYMGFASFFIILVWLLVKPLLINTIKERSNRRELAQLKYHPGVFELLLDSERSIDYSTKDLGITLGNIDSKNILVEICSPFCPACGDANMKIKQLLLKFPDVLKVQVIFMGALSTEDNNPIGHILALAESGNSILTEKSFFDWYSNPKKDNTDFKHNYPLKMTAEKLDLKIEAMNQWCSLMSIDHTPTFFYNGKEIPKNYDLQDFYDIIKQ